MSNTQSAHTDIHIRLATSSDRSDCLSIERDAVSVYRDAGLRHVADARLDSAVLDLLIGGDRVWVAEVCAHSQPVGFLAAGEVGPTLYVEELSVRLAYQRQGIGHALMTHMIGFARWAFFPAVTLTTYRDLPWCAPFYRSLGFMELNETSMAEELQLIRRRERNKGLEPPARVTLMKRL